MKLDHVELFVPDRDAAARWYADVLGFTVMEEHRHWAAGGGPLMISNDGGDTLVALFEGSPQGEEPVRGLRRLAFRVDPLGFEQFLEASGRWRSEPLGRSEVQDHDQAISVYFNDPWGTLLEVTCYDPQAVRDLLAGGSGGD